MKRTWLVLIVAAAVAISMFGWLLLVGLPRWYGPKSNVAVSAPAPAPVLPGKKIKATLFYISLDGLHLSGMEREVAYGDGTTAQAREIVLAQIAPAAPPLLSAIPMGTKLRALYVTERGEAYVDLSRELAAAHPGGSMDELLTIYTIVNALTVNLPAVSAVQILIDGKEVETLAGHVDLGRPFAKNTSAVE